MPIIPGNQVFLSFWIDAEIARNALNINEQVDQWVWEGRGFHGELRAQIPTVYTPDIPNPPWIREQVRWKTIPFREMYDQFFFGEFPESTFDDLIVFPVEDDPLGTGTIDLYLVFSLTNEERTSGGLFG